MKSELKISFNINTLVSSDFLFYTKSELTYNGVMKRIEELQEVKRIIARNRSDLFYLRGRRRVGKSWLLIELQKSKKNTFYFMGSKDARDEATRSQFADRWDQFIGKKKLSLIKKTELTWDFIFEEITNYLQAEKEIHTLVFDEIQWIAKIGSGFCGRIKEWWLKWEKLKTVKIVICGSSNKFFHDNVGGEELLLRGIKTHSDIWVKPFTLRQIKQEMFSEWSDEEVALLFMMTGGIPYYLNQIDPEKLFIHGLNEAFFLKSSIFLEEIDEVLRIEFNKSSVITAKNIFRTLGNFGANQASIIEKANLSKSTVSEALLKMVEYDLIFQKRPLNTAPKANNKGLYYYAKDFYINTYFQILEPLKERIRQNDKSLLFPYEALQSKSGYYIPNFSGTAFEKLLRHCIESGIKFYPGLYEKMQLTDENFVIGDYWDESTQIDLIVEHKKDRISRVIECKWKDEKNINIESLCKEIINKQYIPPKGYTRVNYLFLSYTPTKAALAKCKKNKVRVITLRDLFE